MQNISRKDDFMNDINNFSNNTQFSENSPAPKKRGSTTAKVAGLLAGVIIIGGGAGFGGAYFASRTQNSATVGDVTPNSGNSAQNSNSTNTNSNNVSAPSLDELQSNISSPHHTATSNVEFNTDGTYMYLRDLVSAVRDSVVYVETFVEYRGKNTAYAAGSGVIISSDGYIVTNNHVVENCSSVTIKVNKTDIETGDVESETYDAVLCGTDEDTDLAVLKIDAKDLPAAKLGDSDQLHLGDDVIAIGNPLGYETSVTKGIISGLNRHVSDSRRGLTSIQTDTPINSGNSGGALFNTYGEVVGIVNEKRVDSYAESMGFAITINEAKSVIDDLIGKGYVTGRAILGITYLRISESAAYYRNATPGWLVSEISATSPVANSGLLVGDTIIEIDDVSVLDLDSSSVFVNKKPGDIVKVTVVRTNSLGHDTTVDIDVELDEYKGS